MTLYTASSPVLRFAFYEMPWEMFCVALTLTSIWTISFSALYLFHCQRHVYMSGEYVCQGLFLIGLGPLSFRELSCLLQMVDVLCDSAKSRLV